ncbi:hypothetical protein DL239_13895 [Sedimentitalea sp. CY04]|uniref:Uncharacterized protein n=1 Tax=Parasedimentitalea denitrificans TaxID=2211118 RepID=A0ABX0WCN8_9RHOB|nr:hypothetical protein [Sedimentitalea sp. CY04]
MYTLRPGTKKNPVRRWSLPDRIFFGYGACAILAGTYLRDPPLPGFYAERIVPVGDMPGNHTYVTNGVIAFDYHGYSVRQNILIHHKKCWAGEHRGWSYDLETVEFDLLSTQDLNAHRMLGPDQYLHDPIQRAQTFISRIDHASCFAKAASKALIHTGIPS